MTSKKSHIFAEQFMLFHNVKGWYPPVSEVVKGLTAEQAKWKEGVNHSIWELLAHLTFWNERWLKRFLDESVDQLETNEATFFKKEADRGDEQAWAALLEHFDHVMNAWRKELLTSEDAKMDEALSFDPDSTWWEALSCLTTHNTYHLGQMIMIRKQQGSWNP